jgi:hypothetical protein
MFHFVSMLVTWLSEVAAQEATGKRLGKEEKAGD